MLTVEEARKKAKALRGAAASGGDPVGVAQEKRREKTMTELLDLYGEHSCFTPSRHP